jgi:hypothetical protein
MEPFIFILDLDGTIIGDCTYQVITYNIEELCKKHKVKSKTDHNLLNSYKPSSKLIRPFFKYFIGYIKKYNPQSQFYIYTASEKSWAIKEITMIEKTHNFKFNRPIFTRDDCIIDSYGQYLKSVKKILPKIKYNKVRKENILIIDNNSTFVDYASNFLLCPTYNYILFYDIWEKMKKEYLKVMDIYQTIKKLIFSNKMCKYCHFNDETLDSKQLENKHKWLYKKHKKINVINRKYLQDSFWKTLAHNIVDNKITYFDKDIIKQIQKSL